VLLFKHYLHIQQIDICSLNEKLNVAAAFDETLCARILLLFVVVHHLEASLLKF